ncbi:MAG: hypothetical protein QXZ17_10890 [Nitrososphaerota archaeon]
MTYESDEQLLELIKSGISAKDFVDKVLEGQEFENEDERRKAVARIRMKYYRLKKKLEGEEVEEEEATGETKVTSEAIEVEKPVEVAGVSKEVVMSLFSGLAITLNLVLSRFNYEFTPFSESELELLADTWSPILSKYMGEGGDEAVGISMTLMLFVAHIKKKEVS